MLMNGYAELGKRLQNPKKRNNVFFLHGRNISFWTNKNDDVVVGFFLAKPFFPSKEKTHTQTSLTESQYYQAKSIW